jgi:IPT/TIG domain
MHVRIGVALAVAVCALVGACAMPATSLAAENANFIGHWENLDPEYGDWTITSENFATGECAGTSEPGFSLSECKVTGAAYVFTIKQEGTSGYISHNKGTIKGNTIAGSFEDGSGEHKYNAIRQLNLTGTWSAVYHCEVGCTGAEFPATDTLTQEEGSDVVTGSNNGGEEISGKVTGDTFKYHSSTGGYESNGTLTVAANGLSWEGPLQDSNNTSGTYIAEKVSGASAPSVSSLSPTSGSTLGGTAVTIAGTGFGAGASVSFGSTTASSVTVNSASSITATSPAGSGTVNVTVTTSSGTSATTSGDQFTYVAPAITAIAPRAPLPELAFTSVPAPQLGVTGNVSPVSGTVLVRVPPSTTFVPLASLRQIPFGSVINATHGRVSVTTAAPHGGTQTGEFFEGEFVLTQGHNGLVVAALTGGSFSTCPTARERAHKARASAAHASGKHAVRKLWADAHGSFSTKGNYAAGAVAGTEWLTEDLCEGTLIRVTRDKVAVTNLVNHRHVVVTVGHHYLAKAP